MEHALKPGDSLGPYKIVELVGAGGMGQVYRATDAKLNRDVALKILPDAFASDPDRLARFRREAQVLASLSHPNIGHIYGLEDSGARHALVLELIEGPTLAELIAPRERRSSPSIEIADTLRIALQALALRRGGKGVDPCGQFFSHERAERISPARVGLQVQVKADHGEGAGFEGSEPVQVCGKYIELWHA